MTTAPKPPAPAPKPGPGLGAGTAGAGAGLRPPATATAPTTPSAPAPKAAAPKETAPTGPTADQILEAVVQAFGNHMREIDQGLAHVQGGGVITLEFMQGLKATAMGVAETFKLLPPLIPPPVVEEVPPPVLTVLEPATAVIGAPSFTLHVRGTGFVDGSVIVFAGQDEPTTLVSDTDVTTGVDMSVWLGADPAIPVLVRNPDGAVSNELTFAFTV